MVGNNCSPDRLFLSHFSDCFLSPHRLHREPLSCARPRFHLRGSKRALVARRIARRIFLDDARERNCVAPNPGRGSGPAMVHYQALAVAMALDWHRASWIRGLFIFELADLWRALCLFRFAKGTLSHVVLLAVEWHRRCIPQSSPQSERGRDRWDPGTHLYRTRLCLRDRKLV